MTPRRDASNVRLPLTDAQPTGEALVRDLTPETIALIIDEFYTACRVHPVLGPIFNHHVLDWDAHLARIRAFWSAVLFKTGGYSGRPLEAHLAIPDLSRAHFSIWLRLFDQTVAAHCTPHDAAVFMTMAGRMANRLMASGGVAHSD